MTLESKTYSEHYKTREEQKLRIAQFVSQFSEWRILAALNDMKSAIKAGKYDDFVEDFIEALLSKGLDIGIDEKKLTFD